jgi:molecular chaperone DnaK (HSP70)
MDNLLVEYILEKLKKHYRLDVKNDNVAMMRIREVTEKANDSKQH